MGLKVWGCFFENPCHLAISRDPRMVAGHKFGHKDYTIIPLIVSTFGGAAITGRGSNPQKGFSRQNHTTHGTPPLTTGPPRPPNFSTCIFIIYMHTLNVWVSDPPLTPFTLYSEANH